MQKVQQHVITCNERPNQHQVDDLFWQADEHDRARDAWAVASAEWFGAPVGEAREETDARAAYEQAIAQELTRLWARERELTRALARLWARDPA